MVVELRPAAGVRVAGTADIAFGLRVEELAALVPAARATRVFHTTWARTLDLPGVAVTACGGDDELLYAFEITPTGEPGIPVVYADVDLFGWPADEVIGYLRAEGHRVDSHPRLARVGADLLLFRSDRPGFDSLLFTSSADRAGLR